MTPAVLVVLVVEGWVVLVGAFVVVLLMRWLARKLPDWGLL